MNIRRFLVRALLALVICAGFSTLIIDVPQRYNPFAPLDLKHESGPFVPLKLARLNADEKICYATLHLAKVGFSRIPDYTSGNCALTQMITLEKSAYAYSNPVRGRCALASALAMWESQIVQKAARAHLSSPVARIEHIGIHSCRNVRGSSKRVSQHATANAIDIAGFSLENGKTVSVFKDWGKDTAEGRFLLEVQRGACGIFRGVLGPEYNRLHADHFHFDMGPYRLCPVKRLTGA